MIFTVVLLRVLCTDIITMVDLHSNWCTDSIVVYLILLSMTHLDKHIHQYLIATTLFGSVTVIYLTSRGETRIQR